MRPARNVLLLRVRGSAGPLGPWTKKEKNYFSGKIQPAEKKMSVEIFGGGEFFYDWDFPPSGSTDRTGPTDPRTSDDLEEAGRCTAGAAYVEVAPGEARVGINSNAPSQRATLTASLGDRVA